MSVSDGSPASGVHADEEIEAAPEPFTVGEQLRTFLRNSPEAILVVEGDGTIVSANHRAAALFGYTEPELLDRSINGLIPDASTNANSRRLQSLLQLSDPNAGSQGMDLEGRRKDGSGLALEVSLTPLGPEGQDPCVWTLHAPPRRSADAARAARSEARFNEAQRIGKIGNWEWEIAADMHWWSDELYRMLEMDPGADERFFDVFTSRIHADDRERFESTKNRIEQTGRSEVSDVRIALPSGEERVVQCQGEVELDAAGNTVRVFGTLQDITEQKQAERAFINSEARYKEAQRIAKLGNWEWNLATSEHWWSDELYSILEEDPSKYEASFENFLRKVHKADRGPLIEGAQNPTADPNGSAPSEVRIVLPGGREKMIELRVDVGTNARGEPTVVAGTVRDVTERWELEARLRESEKRYASTVELASIGIGHIDVKGRFLWANQYLCDMLGYPRDELLELTIKQISHREDVHAADKGRAALHAGEIDTLKIEKRYVRKNGATIWARITSTVRRDAAGSPLYDIAAVEDVTERKATEARVQYLATHDEMTGLLNRGSFNQRLAMAIDWAHQRNGRCVILFVDLDRFKVINDSLGHAAGDQLLVNMAERLKHCLRKSDVIARFGGDEFVILLEDVPDVEGAVESARKILSTVLRPIRILNQEFRTTASIGIAVFPDDAKDAVTLMKHADMAMYRAKEEGKNNYQFYSPQDTPISVEHFRLESQLNRALERNEFTVQYQARVDLETGSITGTEALLRWWNHELGTVSPTQFIPLAEDTGLIVPIGRWILRAACEQNVAWQRKGLPPIVIAVNLSPRQFKDADLLTDISEVLAQTQMAPELLELEITEGVLMHDVERAAERIAAIKNQGVRLAIDDFGTGYSSLSQLKRFPIDTLKVDRSFVRDAPENAEDKAITEAIISLGKTLGVTVVAEGVETSAQVGFLRSCGCDEMQGFYFSKPCHPDAVAVLLAKGPVQLL
jgi:diguanylate cyclase (GGDEF)-like protein/PAS domain S-box-containing protein